MQVYQRERNESLQDKKRDERKREKKRGGGGNRERQKKLLCNDAVPVLKPFVNKISIIDISLIFRNL